MKTISFLPAFLALLLPLLCPAAEDAPTGAVLSPAEGPIDDDSSFSVSFPDAMVAGDKIDAGDVAWPVVIEPKVEARFRWLSTTEGDLQIQGHIIPGTTYRISLAPGLKDATDKKVPPAKWEFESAAFAVDSGEDSRSRLSARPRFDINANYPVAIIDAAEHVFFQDRDTHERFPVEVVLEPRGSAAYGKYVTVTPRHPLPVDHTFDVIVDGLRDAFGQKPLPFLHVFPAGTTEPLELSWLGAFNHPLEKPMIRAKFSENIDPDSVAGAFSITPEVPGVNFRADADEVIAEGDFKAGQRYVVLVSPSIRGASGFGLPKEEKWGATFQAKESTIVFPYTQVFQRTARGLKFSFLQVNTGVATWKLSKIPLPRLPQVMERVREYKSGEKSLELEEVGRGEFPANPAGQEEVVREIGWQPPAALSGPYLLEVTAPDKDEDVQGNRTVIFFSEYVLTQKMSDEKVYVRAAKMSDGQGVTGLPIRALSSSNVELATQSTDANGIATFDYSAVYGENSVSRAELFVADAPEGPAIQYVGGSTLASAEYRNREGASKLRSLIITDRNLYRPRQMVKMHGIARLSSGTQLTLPQGGEISWNIKPVDGDPITTGTATLSALGSWEAEYIIPTTLATGSYEIGCEIEGKKAFLSTFRVEEYRVPLFSIGLENVKAEGGSAQLKVSSNYFHGSPNTGAKVRWKASWTMIREISDDQYVRTDRYSEHRFSGQDEQEAEGEAELDREGRAIVRCDPPFKDGRPRGRCNVAWTVDVTSPEAQTQTAGSEYVVQSGKGWAGIRAEVKGEKTVVMEANAIDEDDVPVDGTPVRVELYHVTAKTVREKVGPFIVRYRNTKEFEKVTEKQLATPAKYEFNVEHTGDYVAVVAGPGEVLASTELSVAGEERAEFPVESETQFDLSLPEPARAYKPGEIVPISVRAPFAGVAWVSVEAEDILDTIIVPLAGNSGRIDLPIKKEYSPNATVTVYLLQPGGPQALPRERIGQVKFEVERPDLEMTVTPKLTSQKIRPGGEVAGEVTLVSNGQPVSKAELLVFAVDEAVLQLGDWEMPDPSGVFYPRRALSVSSYAALTRFVEKIEQRSLQQKGYVVGDGGQSLGKVSTVRKDLKTLAYWDASLTTDAAGRAQFKFQAPDNLTEFRLVAFAQTGANQFGGGTTSFKVAKPLMCETALPRFVRVGDELQLRAVARQTVKGTGKITVKCVTEGLELDAPAPISKDSPQDVPSVYMFKARVGETSSSAKIRFEATSDFGESDAVEMSLPILPPAVLRKESVSMTFTSATFKPVEIAPASWLKGKGAYNVTLSTSPWIPKLNGLPTILEYPHGCFEQISSRVLTYALMTDLLKNLPDVEVRDANYRAMLDKSMKRFEEALLYDGTLPYWPSLTTSNYFVTALAAWAVRESEKVGVEISENLSEKLEGALEKIILGQSLRADNTTRAMALMVAAEPDEAANYGSVAEALYLQRDLVSDEGRAFLAIAMHRLGIMPKEKAQLLKEISRPPPERAFDPLTFGSTTRADALATLAMSEIEPANPLLAQRRERLLKLMDSSMTLSTQENLWLLIAFKALHDSRPAVQLAVQTLTPPPPLAAKNQTGAAWNQNDIARISAFEINGLPAATPLTALLSAEYRSTELEVTRTDRGLRVERVVKNLTDAKRDGSTLNPFKLGDQLLITYRLLSKNYHHYVALEDLLPAGLETVNPNLPLIAKTYQIPTENKGRELQLSHSELRDASTCIYFDYLDTGIGVYSTLARATTAGSFRWPATQAYPMYDSRFTALSTASVCVVTE